jgi:phage tail-like protein
VHPFPNFRFYVSLDPIDAYQPPSGSEMTMIVSFGRFSDVTGLSGELDVVTLPEGGQNDYVHQLPAQHKWSRLVLQRGMTQGFSLWDWYQAGLRGPLGARRDGAIVLLDPDAKPACTWTFRAGLASKWTGPELHAREAAVAIESVEIAHHGITQVLSGGPSWPM